MFARTAKVLTLERRHAVQAQVGQASSKIRQSDRLSAALRRRRPVLLCRWQLDPASGRPVCAWDVECPDLAPDLDIEPSWPIRSSNCSASLLCFAGRGSRRLPANERNMNDGPSRPVASSLSIATGTPMGINIEPAAIRRGWDTRAD